MSVESWTAGALIATLPDKVASVDLDPVLFDYSGAHM